MRSEGIDKERLYWVWFYRLACGFLGDFWCVSDGEGRKIENMVSRMR